MCDVATSTCLIGHYNSFSRNYNIAFHVTQVVFANWVPNRLDQQFKIDFEWPI